MADIKKIFPFLSNVDFSSPKTKRNLILGGVFSVLLIVLVVASSAQEKPDETPEQQDPQPKSRSSLTVPEGENNDVTASSRRTIQARNRLRRQGGADIYAQGVDENDPLASVTGRKSGTGIDPLEGAEEDPEPAPKPKPDREKKPAQTVRPSGEAASPGGGTARSERERRRREFYRSRGLDPDTGLPLDADKDGAGSENGNQTQQQAPIEPTKDSTVLAAVTPKVSVRKSGEVSSLKKGRSQTSSLRNRESTVSEEDGHLLKVMFASDQKISSGQRVTLRLLEDMVVDGILVPANTFVSAVCTVGERLSISVRSIELNGKIYQLGYVGYDTDGEKGLYCPQTKENKVKEEVGQQGRQIGRSFLGNRITGIAGEIISAGASILENSKGVVTIQVTSGYTFYLKQERNG